MPEASVSFPAICPLPGETGHAPITLQIQRQLNSSGLIADTLHRVFETLDVSGSTTARRRFPLHVPRTRIRELQ